jgi:hypothetical protein
MAVNTPQPWVTGPGHLFAHVGSAGAPLYLGTAENNPRIEIRPAYSPYFNNLFSPKVPMDLLFQGEEAFLYLDVNRFNFTVWNAMHSRPSPTGTRGTWTAGQLGSFQIFEANAYAFTVQFPYARAKSAMAGLEYCYRFYNVTPVGPDSLEPIGMDYHKRRIILHALPTLTVGIYNTTVGTLFDNVDTGLPTVT